jgi:hypothetical protein
MELSCSRLLVAMQQAFHSLICLRGSQTCESFIVFRGSSGSYSCTSALCSSRKYFVVMVGKQAPFCLAAHSKHGLTDLAGASLARVRHLHLAFANS